MKEASWIPFGGQPNFYRIYKISPTWVPGELSRLSEIGRASCRERVCLYV